ncbi:MAG: hypothetical protein ACREJO_07115 [Phycisphaerales bacterium]
MAIDPMLYEKYSGRSADPTQRMGEALAGASKRSSQIGSGGESDGGRPDACSWASRPSGGFRLCCR